MIELNLLADQGLSDRPSITDSTGSPLTRWIKRVDAGGVILLTLCLVLIARIAFHQIRAPGALERMTQNVMAAEGELAQIARSRAVEERLRLERDSLILKIDQLERLSEEREEWPMLWLMIAEALPPGTALRSFEELSAPPTFRMRVEGASMDDGSIGAFVERLSAMPGVRDVRLLQVEAVNASDGVHTFQFEVAG